MTLCCRGWGRIVCVADNLNHLLLRRFALQRICSLHDRQLGGPDERP